MTALPHLGSLAPSPIAHTRNAYHSYSTEYSKLKRWALAKYGKHERKAFDGSDLPRIARRDAMTMTKWWEDVASDLTGYDQFTREVDSALAKMRVAVGPVATKPPSAAELERELNETEAAYFWEGMSRLSTSVSVAKVRPTLFDKGGMLWEAIADSVVELPERIIDQGKKVGQSFNDGVDRLVTTAKWVGVIGGGLLAVYMITRITPERQPARGEQ